MKRNNPHAESARRTGYTTAFLFILSVIIGGVLVNEYSFAGVRRDALVTLFSVFLSAAVTGLFFSFSPILKSLARSFEEIVLRYEQVNQEAIFHWSFSDFDDHVMRFGFSYTYLTENKSPKENFSWLNHALNLGLVSTSLSYASTQGSNPIQVRVYRSRSRQNLSQKNSDVTDQMFEWIDESKGTYALKFKDHPKGEVLWYKVQITGLIPKTYIDTLVTSRPHVRAEVIVDVGTTNVAFLLRANGRISKNYDNAGTITRQRFHEVFDAADTEGGKNRILAELLWSTDGFAQSFAKN